MNYLVIYPGRFHPFHRGHRASYEYLAKKYGEDHVYIATTGVQAPVTSPFTFADKVQMISTLGIPAGHVVKVSNPYQSREITDSIPAEEKANTVLIFALSAKDAERFNFAPKKDGTASYLQPMPENLKELKPMTAHAYVEIVPTVNFKVRGKDANSASQIREFYIKGNNNDRDQIIADLYGEAYPELRDIFDERLGVTEQVQKIVREARQLKTARSVALLERILTKERRALNEFTQGMTEGREQITELRDRMYQYIKSIVPTWPDYVVKDWLYGNLATGETYNKEKGWSFETIGKGIPKILNDTGLSVNTTWQLVPNVKFTMDMWEPKTLKRLQARAGGSATSTDPMVHIPARDAERHATQAALAQQQGGVRKEPVIIVKTPQGYELLEGWHRTIQHFARYPNGYTGPAYVAVAQGQQGVAEGFSNAVTFFRGEPILSQERLNQLKSSIGKPYPILRKEGSAANIGTYMSPDGDKATSFVKQALAGQGKGGVVTQIQVNPNSFSKGDGGIDEAVIITNIAGLVSNQTPNKNDPLRIQDRKQAMLKYLGPGVKKYLNDPLLSDPKIVQSWYNPEFAQKNWNTINSGKQAVTKPGESNMQERMMRVLGPLAENIRRDPQVISYFISHNPGDWVEYNFRMNSDGSGTKVVDVKYYPPAKQGVAEGESPANTLYFFDVGRGGRSFTNVDLRAMGLQQSQSGKWYYRPGANSTPELLKSTLEQLTNKLNVPPKPWQRPQTNEGIRDVLNFGIKKPAVKPAAPMDDFTAKMIANKQKNLKIVHPKDVYKSPDEYTRATGNKIKESADYLEEK